MTEIQPIEWGIRYFEDRPVLTATLDGVLYFEGNSFCRITEHKNAADAITKHVAPLQRKKFDVSAAHSTLAKSDGGATWENVGPNPLRWFITREGANRLVLDSTVPGAVRIKQWLADEVMPSIEDHGGYIAPGVALPAMPDFSSLDAQALAYLGHVGQALALTSQQLIETQAENAKLRVKAQRYDDWINGKGCYLIGTVAKMLGLGPKAVWDFLYEEKILISKGARRREPYAGKPSTSWFEVKPRDLESTNGHATNTTYITPYGAEQLRLLLITRGLLPPQQLALIGGAS